MSLTIMAPGHVDFVKPTLWFIDPVFSTSKREKSIIIGAVGNCSADINKDSRVLLKAKT